MIVNDMVTLGIFPVSIAMQIASGAGDWFSDEQRSHDLLRGWRDACELAGCVWSGGETPTLKDVVNPGAVALSGSAWGMAKENILFNPDDISDGDLIVLLTSSGIHANGLTLARKIIAEHQKTGRAQLTDGRRAAEALLDPTHIYVDFIKELLSRNVRIHYGVNITGHGWRKLMRARGRFSYIIEEITEPQPIFSFLQENGPITDEEMYGTFNMGAGFALFVPPNDVELVQRVADDLGYPFSALIAGHIENSDQKNVIIRPKGLEFKAESLQVR